MVRAVTLSIICGLLVYGCTGISPEKQRDIAFEKYSMDCVARGIPENTPAHTQCVMAKYEAHHKEQKRAKEEIAKFYGLDTKKSDQNANKETQ